MRIFNKTDRWRTKVNFVDENNVLLGYDITDQCGENAGWYIADTVKFDVFKQQDEFEESMPNWVFDTKFFDEKEYQCPKSGIYQSTAVFRIVNNIGQEKYIHVFNVQNGYYSHGFEFKSNHEIFKNGAL